MKVLNKNKKVRKWFIIGVCSFFLLATILATQSCAEQNENQIQPLLPNPQLWDSQFLNDHVERIIEENRSNVAVFKVNNEEVGWIIFKLNKEGNTYGGNVFIKEEGETSGFTTRGIKSLLQNQWQTINNLPVWTGVFQSPNPSVDKLGAIVVITDAIVDTGEGPSHIASGSVWFREFPKGGNDGFSPTSCRDVSIGPYDCRFSLSQDDCGEDRLCPKIVTRPYNKNNRNPYRKWGTFENVNLIGSGFYLIGSGFEEIGRYHSSLQKKESFLSRSFKKMKSYLKHFLNFFK